MATTPSPAAAKLPGRPLGITQQQPHHLTAVECDAWLTVRLATR